MLSRTLSAAGAAALFSVYAASTALGAGPQVVQGPGASPECFAPFSADTKYFQFAKKRIRPTA
jgi:ribose transport system substrate-binding protein